MKLKDSNPFSSSLVELPEEPNMSKIPKQLSEQQVEMSALRGRLKRRNLVIDAIRKAYLRDVVTVKQHLLKKIENPEYDPSQSTELVHRIPSLDLRPTLELFAPVECSLRVRSCESCGGQLEVVHRESKRLVSLSKHCTELQKIEQEVRLRASRLEIQAEKDRRALEIELSKSKENRAVFLNQIAKLREQLGRFDMDSFEQMKKDIKLMEADLALTEQKLSTMDELKARLEQTELKAGQLEENLTAKEVTMRELEMMHEAAGERSSLVSESAKRITNS